MNDLCPLEILDRNVLQGQDAIRAAVVNHEQLSVFLVFAIKQHMIQCQCRINVHEDSLDIFSS